MRNCRNKPKVEILNEVAEKSDNYKVDLLTSTYPWVTRRYFRVARQFSVSEIHSHSTPFELIRLPMSRWTVLSCR